MRQQNIWDSINESSQKFQKQLVRKEMTEDLECLIGALVFTHKSPATETLDSSKVQIAVQEALLP